MLIHKIWQKLIEMQISIVILSQIVAKMAAKQ